VRVLTSRAGDSRTNATGACSRSKGRAMSAPAGFARIALTHMEQSMRVVVLSAILSSLLAGAVFAALPNGMKAPDFTADASLAGKPFKFSLAEALKKGPVVLYFYPKAFTSGCTIEAHNFAEATDKFSALGATVIGVSNDDIETLHKFSVSECRNKFAVAADQEQKVMRAYDSVFWMKRSMASRTSYVIAPTGEIIYSYTALSPNKHVNNTLAAVEQWRASHKDWKAAQAAR
jgi:peroxiredoxin